MLRVRFLIVVSYRNPNDITSTIMNTNANSMPVPAKSLTLKTTPFNQGYLPLTNLHRMYFAEYGIPDGPAAVVLHGGPGSASNSGMLDWFDLSRQRVVLFDQRGAGRSLPSGMLEDNHTAALIQDIERLRSHLGIDRWMVVGGSWGTLLAVLYTASFKQHVRSLILRGTFLGSEPELSWFFQSLRALAPQAWNQLTDGWNLEQQQHVLQNLTALLHNGTVDQQQDAAARWSTYENKIMATMLGIEQTGSTPVVSTHSPVTKYRIQSHYLSQHCFVSQEEVCAAAQQITALPVILVHGTHDWICPPESALRLHTMLPAQAQLRWVVRGGHTPQDPAMLAALKQVIAEYAI